MRSFLPWLGAALLALAGAAQAQIPPQTPQQTEQLVEGHDLALALCSVCHIAAADQVGTPVMSSPGPPFRAIANRAEVTPASLRHFMLTAHSATTPPFTMPNAKLSDRQLDAVIAYILSLRGQP
jgi:mono/diheme cytochrome c family protein